MVKILTILLSTISNSQEFLLKKNVGTELLQITFFFQQKNINIYAIFNDQRFNDTLINDIVSFEQLSPGDKQMWPWLQKKKKKKKR